MANKAPLEHVDPYALRAALRLMGFESTLKEDALWAAVRPLIEVTDEIGIKKPVSKYTYSEAMKLIEAVVNAYENYLEENDQHKE